MKNHTFVWFLPLSVFLLLGGLFSAARANTDSIFNSFLPVIQNIPNELLLYHDDFSDPDSGWPIEDDGVVRWQYRKKGYEIMSRDPDVWAGARAPVVGFEDYGVEAAMQRLGGITSDYGLVFDWLDWGNFYFFVMDPGDQWFGVAKVVNDVPKLIIPRTDSARINPDNGVNHLRVDRLGNEMVVYINGSQVASAKDTGFAGDLGAGFYMGPDDDVPATVRYDNFTVWSLTGATSQQLTIKPQSQEAMWANGTTCAAGGLFCLFD